MAGSYVAILFVLLPGTISSRVDRRSLLQVGGKLHRGQSEQSLAAISASESRDPHDAAWFNNFNLEESDSAALQDPGMMRQQGSAAGRAEAMQTHRLSSGNSAVQKPDWKVKHTQLLQNVSDQSLRGHEVRTVSGNLTCEKPGCSANTTLQIYNPLIELVDQCKLSFAVHATDFDDNFAGERIYNILANGRAVGGDCFPDANGCVSQLSREFLYSCVQDYPVDTIISSQGTLLMMAAIPKVVDECPYNNNLLHGVATIACNVAKITTTTTTATFTPSPVLPETNRYIDEWKDKNPDSFYNSSDVTKAKPVQLALPSRPQAQQRVQLLSASGKMRCAERGCTASLVLDLNQTLLSLDKCMVQMIVNQTDFDNTDGAFERLSVNVSGKEMLVNAEPGKNPCRSFYAGKALTQEEMSYTAIKDLDITNDIRNGPVVFTARISRQVDECPSNGYLLDSTLEVHCNVTTIGAFLEQKDTLVRDVLKLNSVLLEGTSSQADDAVKEFLEDANAAAEHDAEASSENLTNLKADDASSKNLTNLKADDASLLQSRSQSGQLRKRSTPSQEYVDKH